MSLVEVGGNGLGGEPSRGWGPWVKRDHTNVIAICRSDLCDSQSICFWVVDAWGKMDITCHWEFPVLCFRFCCCVVSSSWSSSLPFSSPCCAFVFVAVDVMVVVASLFSSLFCAFVVVMSLGSCRFALAE